MVRIKIAGSNSLLAVLKSNFVPQTKAMFVFKQLDVDMMMLWVIFPGKPSLYHLSDGRGFSSRVRTDTTCLLLLWCVFCLALVCAVALCAPDVVRFGMQAAKTEHAREGSKQYIHIVDTFAVITRPCLKIHFRTFERSR